MNVFPPLLRLSCYHALSYYMLVMSEAINVYVALMCSNSSEHRNRVESELWLLLSYYFHWFVLALGLAVLLDILGV